MARSGPLQGQLIAANLEGLVFKEWLVGIGLPSNVEREVGAATLATASAKAAERGGRRLTGGNRSWSLVGCNAIRCRGSGGCWQRAA